VEELDKIYEEIKDNIATPKAWLIFAEALKKAGKPERVIMACKKVLEVFPDDMSIRMLLAETYFEQGHDDLAETELERLSRKINQLSPIYKLQAELFRKNNRIEDAIQSLQQYLAHNSSDQDAVELLADLSTPTQEEPSALPTSTLAELYYKQGELEEAIKIYEQVVATSPQDEGARIRLNELKEIKETQERRKKKEYIIKERKLKLIRILERWLAAIKQRKAEILSPQM
jgi:tetratricopeptide (TPR) repeat protein